MKNPEDGSVHRNAPLANINSMTPIKFTQLANTVFPGKLKQFRLVSFNCVIKLTMFAKCASFGIRRDLLDFPWRSSQDRGIDLYPDSSK